MMNKKAINKLDITTLKQGLTIKVNLLNQAMQFKTRFGVFSPKAIDEGTLFLLDYLDYKPDDISLDLGCGYGAIGLSLAKVCPQGLCYLVDKDFVSVNLANQNIILNKLSNAHAQLSDGLRDLDPSIKFTHIVSNMPAKVGKEQMAIFLADAYEAMAVGGRFSVVTINGLRDYMKRNFNEVFGNYQKIKQGKNYTISSCIKE